MKKSLLLLLLMMISYVGFSQFTFSGTVTNTSSAPVAGQTVYVTTDSILNPSSIPYWVLTAVTNSAGAYSVTMPSTTTSGTFLRAYTANCSGSVLVNNHTYAGVNITTSNFVKCIPPPPATVSGMVTLGTSGGAAAVGAKVYAIEKRLDSSTTGGLTFILTVKDSAVTNSSGNYSIVFPSIAGGSTLLVKAFLLPSHTNYSSYLPTYYTSSLVWSGATSTGAGSSVNIALIGGTNPGGPGFIGGDVLLGANKTTAVGDPLPGREIILTNAAGQAIAYTMSDAAGKFSFPNLAYGTYKILGDVLSKTSAPLTITLSATNNTISNVLFEENSKTFDAKLNTTSIANVSTNLQSLVVYPNPVQNTIYVAGLDKINGDKTITLNDVTGKQVYSSSFKQTDAVMIPAAQLANGVYLLNITTTEGSINLKIVK